MDAYNAALANVENATFYSAEDFITDNQQAAQENMEEAVSDFVEATLAIVEVIAIEEAAATASETGDIADQEALQDFIQDNDVYITFDGTTPSASNGHVLPNGQGLLVISANAAKAAKFLRSTSNDGVIHATQFVD